MHLTLRASSQRRERPPMRIPLLRTLSGRIVLGFTVLTLTFGTISAIIVGNMELLGRQIRIIRIGYLPLALETKNLDEKQDALWSYITDELASETLPNRAERRLLRHMQARTKSLRDTEKVLTELAEVAPNHASHMVHVKQQVQEVRQAIDDLDDRYRQLLETPPLEVSIARETVSETVRNQYRRAKKTLDDLRKDESEIRAQIRFLARQQSERAKQIALTLERNEQRVRLFAIYLGLIAVTIGLLITLWATMTLRPLRRLRDGARRIAQGQYRSRIAEDGPVEVADLAREFNVMARAIEERERELVRSERLIAVGKMAAVITHEVRNPLSSIGLNTELLEEELSLLSDDRAAEALGLCRAINTEVDRLAAITEEYLQFARLPKPKLQLEDLNAIANNLAQFEREQMSQRQVHLRTSLASGLPMAQVDDAQMRQALLNLLRNAADAVAEVGGGEVTLATRHVYRDGKPMLRVSVSDAGPGISEEIQTKLFEPFFSTKQGGTGLGLALTQQIIHEHGGSLGVESKHGKGATFTIEVPAAK